MTSFPSNPRLLPLPVAAALLAFFLALPAFAQPSTAFRAGEKHAFSLGKEDFLLDGKPFQIIAGELHYARIPKEYWRHRLRMARAAGLNTVATYVFWNYHEPKEGAFDFATENRDLAEFLRIAGEEGLWAIVRPGPYACAEWEFGGYPWWLLRHDSLVVRSTDARFLKASERYLERLGREVAPLQITRGGNVIMVQVENEYGSFGADTVFMGATRDAIIAAGFDVPLFTADGPSQARNGHVAGVLPAINGDENPQSLRDTVRKWNGGHGPYFSPEFYPGWLDHWGEKHATVEAKANAAKFEGLIADGISVNIYVFHGGTNFGFTSGANYGGRFQPQPTSYDYDAPLDEAGRATPKYFALREAILRHRSRGEDVPEPPPANPVITIPPIAVERVAGLLDRLPSPVLSKAPLPMERAGAGTGFVLYRTVLGPGPGGRLTIDEPRDYAVVLLDGKKIGSLDRRHRQRSLDLPAVTGAATLDILIENGGRINYGSKMTDNAKGITREVRYNGEPLTEWKIFALPVDDIGGLPPSTSSSSAATADPATPNDAAPAFFRGTFTLAATGDAFLDLSAWGKGCVWVNGRNLGRFWSIGPQQTLYCPGPWLKKGINDIVVLELEDRGARTVAGLDAPVLDRLADDPLAPPAPLRPQASVKLDPATAVLSGSFNAGDSTQAFTFKPREARYIALESLSSQRDDPFASAAELHVLDDSGRAIDRSRWSIRAVDSEELDAEDGKAENAIDGDPETIWHTRWGSAKPPHPHALVLDLGEVKTVGGFTYLSRRGGAPGKIREFRVYLATSPFPDR